VVDVEDGGAEVAAADQGAVLVEHDHGAADRLGDLVDEKVLRRLWALLWLPAQLRRAWEQRFPVLAEIRRVTTATV
jgi:hypothetical protein